MTTILPFPSAASAWRGGRPAPAADPDGFEALLAALLPAAQAPADPAAGAGTRGGVTPAWPGDLAGVSRVADAPAGEGEAAAGEPTSDEVLDASDQGTGEIAGSTSGAAAADTTGAADSPAAPGGEDQRAVTGVAAGAATARQASLTATGAAPVATGPAPSPEDGGSASVEPASAHAASAHAASAHPTAAAHAATLDAADAHATADGPGTVAAPGVAARGAAGPATSPAPRAAPTAATAPGAAADTPATAPGAAADTPAVTEGEPAAPPAPATATGSPGPAAATRSALAQRVAEIVERLELAPPPRRITVELGELRLTVSLRGDGVQVTSSGAPAPAGWREELAASLAQRGFTLAGEGGERDGRGSQGHRGDADEWPGPAAPGTAASGPARASSHRPPAGDASRAPAGLRL